MRTALLVAGVCVAGATHAHVTIDNPEASAGSYAKVALNVTHGCEGSPTRAVTVQVPSGFLLAKAKAKAGWTVTYERTPLARPLDMHGRKIAETTSVVRWQGGTLADDQFDDFVLSGRLADDATGSLSFRVIQTCDKGEIDWAGPPGSRQPAPVLRVVPGRSGARHPH